MSAAIISKRSIKALAPGPKVWAITVSVGKAVLSVDIAVRRGQAQPVGRHPPLFVAYGDKAAANPCRYTVYASGCGDRSGGGRLVT